MAKRRKPSNDKGHRAFAPCSSKIIKAGALIGDTKMLLSPWELRREITPLATRLEAVGKPAKEIKQYWDELMEAQCEWSSIGKQPRHKGLVKC